MIFEATRPKEPGMIILSLEVIAAAIGLTIFLLVQFVLCTLALAVFGIPAIIFILLARTPPKSQL